ncbi:MAG: DNA repair exonuclease, partial [Actinobacteria bacterium]|nr:DNA repair exonuclease [Actinomycetota bacterium]
PCRPGRLAERGYAYWALGHIHQRESLVADPPVVFAGCLQGGHIREAGPKGGRSTRSGGRSATSTLLAPATRTRSTRVWATNSASSAPSAATVCSPCE